MDSAAPPTAGSNQLRWTGDRTLQVNWTLTDLRRDRLAQALVFISGVLLGVASSLLTDYIDRIAGAH